METKSYNSWKENMLRMARAKKTLVSGQFELTACCNLDCKMCYVHNLDHCEARKKELSTQEWKDIFDEAYSAGLLFATLTGGECLLRPDFKELYLHLWKKRVFVDVLTNGTLINRDYVEFFTKYPPKMIQISLYGSSEEGYLKITGHKGFEKVTANIQALKDAGLNVKVVVTPSKYMYEDYISVIRYAKERGWNPSLAAMTLIPNRDNSEKNDYYLTQAEMIELSIRRSELYHKLTPNHITPEPGGRETQPRTGLDCNAGNCIMTITWNGKMHPCPNALTEGFDVLQLGFGAAWKKTQASAGQVLLPVECDGCPYEKVCIRCPMSRSPKRDGHCDPAVCEMTRALVAAGVKKLEAPAAESCN